MVTLGLEKPENLVRPNRGRWIVWRDDSSVYLNGRKLEPCQTHQEEGPAEFANASLANQRDAILTATNDAGLMTRPAWTLMHHLEPYRACPRAPLPVAESLAQRIINLPSSAGLA